MKRERIGLTGALLIVCAVFLAILAGAMEAADAQREMAHYCSMVADGFWPDYRGDYEEVCHD